MDAMGYKARVQRAREALVDAADASRQLEVRVRGLGRSREHGQVAAQRVVVVIGRQPAAVEHEPQRVRDDGRLDALIDARELGHDGRRRAAETAAAPVVLELDLARDRHRGVGVDLEQVRLDMSDDSMPAKFTLGESFTYVVMPISGA